MAQSKNSFLSALASSVTSSGTVPAAALAPEVTANIEGAGTAVYDSASQLPVSGFSAGDTAFVKSTSRLYINSGVGWYNVAVINKTPIIQSVLDSDGGTTPFSLSKEGVATTITITATDSDGEAIIYAASADSNFNGLATLSQTDNVFTITPLSQDSATTTTSTITFTATDGINIASSISTFNLQFGGDISSGDALTSGNLIYRSSTSSTTITISDANVTAYVGLIGGGGAGAGYYYGGGGGAGELLVTDEVTLTPGTYTFVCGSAGTGPANTLGSVGGDGGQSSITMSSGGSIAGSTTTIYAYGGGRGGQYYELDVNGNQGGSGGGGGGNGSSVANATAGGAARTHTYTNWTAYANAGATPNDTTVGGGGGGAGNAGSTATGGDGLDLRTIDSDLGTAWNTVRSTYYIGGGGGGGRIGNGDFQGGAGGGGDADYGSGNATAGVFGGGGGGGGHVNNPDADNGAAGGVGAFFIYVTAGTVS